METAGKKVENEEERQAMKDCGIGTPATRAAMLSYLRDSHPERAGDRAL